MNLYKLHNNPSELSNYDKRLKVPMFAWENLNAAKTNKALELQKHGEEYKRVFAKSPYYAYMFAINILKGRFPEGEAAIATHPKWATAYADRILLRRFPEAEPTILKNPKWAFFYAKDVLKQRWIEAEDIIQTDTDHWKWYTSIWNSAKRNEDLTPKDKYHSARGR